MNQKPKRFSQTNFSYVEELKSNLQKLDLVRNTTNTMIVHSDLLRKTNTKLKTSIQQKSPFSIGKQSSPHSSIQPTNKLILTNKSHEPKAQFHPTLFNQHISPSILNSPTNDEHSIFSIDSEQISIKEKFHHDFQEDSQSNEFPHRKYRTTRSMTSSPSTSKHSRDEPPLPPDTLIIGKLYILNEIYPSIEHENMTGTPLAFLGIEKFLRTRIDWTKVQYPLSSYYIEIIIDLIISRPSFIREIPKVTKFNLYRPLIKTFSGHLFFDHGENKAGLHRCDRKQINHKFTIQDLVSIHRREFYIINYNVTREQRFVNLYENLFQIHSYQTKSTKWKTFLIKSKRPINTFNVTSDTSLDNADIHHVKTLLTLNRKFSPGRSIDGSTRKRSIHYRKSINSQQPSSSSSPIVQNH